MREGHALALVAGADTSSAINAGSLAHALGVHVPKAHEQASIRRPSGVLASHAARAVLAQATASGSLLGRRDPLRSAEPSTACRGGPSRPVTTRDRGRLSGSVSRQSRASREPAFVLGARCNSSRPHGRGRDQHPRVEDDRWHTNASRRVLRHRGRWQMPTGGGNGRARGEGRRDVGPAARRAGTTCPKRVGPAQSLEQRRVDLTSAVCSESRLLTKTLDSLHVTVNKPGTGCSSEHTHLSRRRSFGPVMGIRGEGPPW